MSNIKSYKSLSTDKGFSLSTNTKGFKQFFSEDGNGDRISTHGSNLEAYQLQLFSRIFVNLAPVLKKSEKISKQKQNGEEKSPCRAQINEISLRKKRRRMLGKSTV